MSRVPEGRVVRAYRPSAMCEDDPLDGLPQEDEERQERMRTYCRRAESRLPLFNASDSGYARSSATSSHEGAVGQVDDV